MRDAYTEYVKLALVGIMMTAAALLFWDDKTTVFWILLGVFWLIVLAVAALVFFKDRASRKKK